MNPAASGSTGAASAAAGPAPAVLPTAKAPLPALVFASAVSQLGFVIAGPILVDAARSFHLPLALVAQGQTLQSLGDAGMAMGATLIADRLPRKQQLLWGLALMALAGAALSVIAVFPAWLLVQALAGAAAGLVALACATAIGDYVAEARRGAAMGYLAAGLGLAWLVGVPIVGWVASTWGWRSAYAVLGGGAATVCWLAVALGMPSLPHPTAGTPSALTGWTNLLSRRAAKALLLGDALTGAAWSGFLVYIGPFFGVVYAMRASAIGTMLALASLIGLCAMLSAAPLAGRFGGRRVLLASTMLSAAAIAVPMAARLTPILSLAALAPYIYLSCVRFPASGTIALALAPEARGTMMAARGFAISAAGMAGSLVCGGLLAAGGFGAIGIGCAVLTTAGAFAYWRALRRGEEVANQPE